MEGAPGQRYRAYMLRLRWTGDEPPVWRASLEEVTGGELTVFPSLDAMLAWLKEQIHENAAGQAPATAN